MDTKTHLVEQTESGLYCPEGDFFIDPCRSVERAVITHAHADHARPGCRSYLATPECARLLKARLCPDVNVQELSHGTSLKLNDLRLSLHPAGHILGSAQVRLERAGEAWVVTGDFKRDPDPTCAPFEPLRCHTLVMESTFGLPVFRWPAPETVMAEISVWWRKNAAAGRPSLLFAYALGKAQRILASVDATTGPIFTHDAVEPIVQVYREAGIRLPPTRAVADARKKDDWARALVVAPPSAEGSAWMRCLGECEPGVCVGLDANPRETRSGPLRSSWAESRARRSLQPGCADGRPRRPASPTGFSRPAMRWSATWLRPSLFCSRQGAATRTGR